MQDEEDHHGKLNTEYWAIFTLNACAELVGVSGPEVSTAESTIPQYTVETLAIAVVAGSVAALVVGFVTGYLCGRKCHKEEEDNLPYPDTEYEYFEQRQNVNRYDHCTALWN